MPLGDVVFVELPEVGRTVQAGEEVAVVESVKAASDIYAPVAGTIIGCNDVLDAAPETVNEAPFDGGWFFKLQPADDNALNELTDTRGLSGALRGGRSLIFLRKP